jgi:hypothetical protein
MRSTGAIPASRKRALAPEPRSQAPSDRQSRAVAMAAARDRRDRDHQPAGGIPSHTTVIDCEASGLSSSSPKACRPTGTSLDHGHGQIRDHPRSARSPSDSVPGALTAAAPPAAHRCRADASGPDRGAAAQGLGRRYPGEQVRAPSRTFRKPGSAPRRRGGGSPFAFTRLRIVLAPDPNRRTDPVVMALATPGRHLRACRSLG